MKYITRKSLEVSNFAMKDCIWCGGKGLIYEPAGLGVMVVMCTCVDQGKLLSISHEENSHIGVRLIMKG